MLTSNLMLGCSPSISAGLTRPVSMPKAAMSFRSAVAVRRQRQQGICQAILPQCSFRRQAADVGQTPLHADPTTLLQQSTQQTLLALIFSAAAASPALASPQELAVVAEGLETPVQLLYLLLLLTFLVVGAYLVVRQVLIKRELEEAAKVLGERVRTGEAVAEDYFELGVILLRKKLFTQATRNLEKAKKVWEGEPEELAQVHNALGYAYFNMSRYDAAIKEYKQAVSLQPGYVTAWNNLGNAYEQKKELSEAFKAYGEALSYDVGNQVARQRYDSLKTRLDRLQIR